MGLIQAAAHEIMSGPVVYGSAYMKIVTCESGLFTTRAYVCSHIGFVGGFIGGKPQVTVYPECAILNAQTAHSFVKCGNAIYQLSGKILENFQCFLVL